METIAVTIKTISAMVALKPVVTPAFFHAFLTAALKVRVYCDLHEAICKSFANTANSALLWLMQLASVRLWLILKTL